MSVCCCANPACMLYGCQNTVRDACRYQPIPQQPHGPYTFAPKPVTEERIREILREEIGRVFPK